MKLTLLLSILLVLVFTSCSSRTPSITSLHQGWQQHEAFEKYQTNRVITHSFTIGGALFGKDTAIVEKTYTYDPYFPTPKDSVYTLIPYKLFIEHKMAYHIPMVGFHLGLALDNLINFAISLTPNPWLNAHGFISFTQPSNNNLGFGFTTSPFEYLTLGVGRSWISAFYNDCGSGCNFSLQIHDRKYEERLFAEAQLSYEHMGIYYQQAFTPKGKLRQIDIGLRWWGFKALTIN